MEKFQHSQQVIPGNIILPLGYLVTEHGNMLFKIQLKNGRMASSIDMGPCPRPSPGASSRPSPGASPRPSPELALPILGLL